MKRTGRESGGTSLDVKTLAGLATASLSLWGCASRGTPSHFRQPAEFEPQQAVWLCPETDEAEHMRIAGDMISALTGHVTIKLLLPDSAAVEKTREELSRRGIPMDPAQVFINPMATLFIRDGAVFLIDGRGALAVLDLKWSMYGLPSWCEKLYPGDKRLVDECRKYIHAEKDGLDVWFAKTSRADVITSSLFLENAAFEVNGAGVLLISEPLALSRNPGRTRSELESELQQIPGIRKVIWLGAGLAQDPLEISTIEGTYVGMGAHGHTDEFVRFADASTILLAWVDENATDQHPVNRINRARMRANYEILSRATDQDGRPFRIIKVPMPDIVERRIILAPATDYSSPWNEESFPKSEGRKAGDEVVYAAAASYLNLLIANDVVLVPSYVEDGTPVERQGRVRDQLAAAFPGRTISFVHCTPLNWHGGGPHCATLSEPAR
jgi:agmatine deiminase